MVPSPELKAGALSRENVGDSLSSRDPPEHPRARGTPELLYSPVHLLLLHLLLHLFQHSVFGKNIAGGIQERPLIISEHNL